MNKTYADYLKRQMENRKRTKDDIMTDDEYKLNKDIIDDITQSNFYNSKRTNFLI